MRCLTLAKKLREEGWRCFFLLSSASERHASLAQDIGYSVNIFEPASLQRNKIAPAAASQNTFWEERVPELGSSIKFFKKLAPKLVVIDHYGVDVQWQKKVEPFVGKMMVIDDWASRPQHCDLLLNSSPIKNLKIEYEGLIHPNTELLLGPDYAFIGEQYTQLTERPRKSFSKVSRILGFFGGSDRNNLSTLAIRVFSQSCFRNFSFDLVLPANHHNRSEIARIASDHPNIHLHSLMPTLLPLMRDADISLRGQFNVWEQFFMGVPSVALCVSKKHEELMKQLASS